MNRSRSSPSFSSIIKAFPTLLLLSLIDQCLNRPLNQSHFFCRLYATMNLKYYQYYLLLLALLILPPPSQSNNNNNKFLDCATTSIPCGDSSWNISYPFRRRGMPSYCGHPSFEVECISDMLVITISRKAYRVTVLTYDNQFIAVSRLEFLHDSCPQTFSNTSVDFSLFNYSSNGMNMTMFFNCSPLSHPQTMKNIPCLSNGTRNQSYYSLPGDEPPRPAVELYEKCSSVVLIPMFKEVKDLLVKGRLDFLGVLQDGFGLNWVVGNGWCGECRESGGVCGSDPNHTNASACFCNDGRATNGTCPAVNTFYGSLKPGVGSLLTNGVSDFHGSLKPGLGLPWKDVARWCKKATSGQRAGRPASGSSGTGVSGTCVPIAATKNRGGTFSDLFSVI